MRLHMLDRVEEIRELVQKLRNDSKDAGGLEIIDQAADNLEAEADELEEYYK